MKKPKDHRVENTVLGLKEDYAWHLRYTLAKYDDTATPRDRYTAFAFAVRDRIVERWMETQERYHRQNTRRVYYLSLEFLIGRLLGNNVINLKIDRECSEALKVLEDEARFGTILRMKGILEATDGGWIHFDYTPGEYEVRDGGADYTGRLCVIGVDLKEDNIKALLGM